MVLTFHFKYLLILIVTILAYHSSALSKFCINIEDTNLGDDNVNISCAMLSNMLNISWMTEEYVDRLYIDYTCMTSGLELVTGIVLRWGEGNTLIEDVFPTASSPSNFEPTCYIDGCYDWTSPRAGFPTWSIPTVTCTAETSLRASPPVKTIIPQLQSLTEPLSSSLIPAKSLSSSFHVTFSIEDPSNDQAGLTLYIWIVAVVVIATGMLVTITGVMIILTANRLHSRRVKCEVAEDQPESSHPEIAEHDESPHRLGTLSAEQLHRRSQLPSIEQQAKRNRLSPLRLFSQSKYIDKQHRKQLKGCKGDAHRNSCIQETPRRFQEPIQGNLTGATVEQQDSPPKGIHLKDEYRDDKSRNDSIQEYNLNLQRQNTASMSTSAQHSVHVTLEDTDRRGHRGDTSTNHHQKIFHDSEVTLNIQPPADKEESNENESTLV